MTSNLAVNTDNFQDEMPTLIKQPTMENIDFFTEFDNLLNDNFDNLLNEGTSVAPLQIFKTLTWMNL